LAGTIQADPNVIGKADSRKQLPRTVIGVLPRSFRFLSSDARCSCPLHRARKIARHRGGIPAEM